MILVLSGISFLKRVKFFYKNAKTFIIFIMILFFNTFIEVLLFFKNNNLDLRNISGIHIFFLEQMDNIIKYEKLSCHPSSHVTIFDNSEQS